MEMEDRRSEEGEDGWPGKGGGVTKAEEVAVWADGQAVDAQEVGAEAVGGQIEGGWGGRIGADGEGVDVGGEGEIGGQMGKGGKGILEGRGESG